jgi:prophage regulatory protein
MLQKTTAIPSPSLPQDGMSRFTQIKPFIPVSREKWRQLVRAGKAPQPIYLSSTCVLYRNSEIHAWLAEPVNYRAEVAV